MTTVRTGALCLSFLFGLWLAACTVSTAQPASPTPSAAVGEPKELGSTAKKEPEKKQKKKVRVNHADRARYDSARGMFYLFRNKTGSKGPIEFQDEDMKLICDEAIYDENDDTAACAGNLKITDEESVITGDHINADFDAEIARVEGNVKIVTTETIKKKEGETEEKEETRVTTIWCDEIEYTYTDGARRAVAKGNLKAVQKDKTVLSPKADFDLEKDIVVLAAPVQITLDNGSQFTTDGATISTAEDWMEMGQIIGFFINDRDEDKEPEPEEGTGTETPPAETPPTETRTPTPPAGEGGE